MDIGAVLVSVCAFGFVCMGSLGLLAFVLLRIAGRNVSDLIRDVTGGSEETFEPIVTTPRNRMKPKRDSGGFDAAVQRHARNSGTQPPSNASSGGIPNQENPFRDDGGSGLGEIDPDLRSLRGQRSSGKKRQDDYQIYDDEVGDAGDMMDLFG